MSLRELNNCNITCDDFGLDKSIDHAIFDLIKLIKLTNVSFLVTHIDKEYILNNFSDNIKRQDFHNGLHINLTEGYPISEIKKIPTLVGATGQFYPLNILIKKILLGKINFEDIQKEINAQFEKMESIFGKVNYIDGHQHIQYLMPILKSIQNILKIKKINIPIRSGYFICFKKIDAKKWILNMCSILNKRFIDINLKSNYILDFQDIVFRANKFKDKKILNDIEIMLHVAHPKIDSKKLLLSSYDYLARVKQYKYIRKMI